jgi:alpha/beta superfamily hydrolase
MQKRNIGLYTKVSEEEKNIIYEKMKSANTNNIRGYLRKMATEGYIISVDMNNIKELVILLRSISNNINQIAKRTNETGNFYAEEMKELQQQYQKIWCSVEQILNQFS